MFWSESADLIEQPECMQGKANTSHSTGHAQTDCSLTPWRLASSAVDVPVAFGIGAFCLAASQPGTDFKVGPVCEQRHNACTATNRRHLQSDIKLALGLDLQVLKQQARE